MGYPWKGQHVCRVHGARTPAGLASGERRQQEDAGRQLCARWAVPIDTDPTQAILGRIAAYAGHVEFYRQQVEQLETEDMVWGITKSKTGGDDHGTTREAVPNVWLNLYNDASAMLVKFAADALRSSPKCSAASPTRS
jgi:hypothetical protein